MISRKKCSLYWEREGREAIEVETGDVPPGCKKNLVILRTARQRQRLPRLAVQGPSYKDFKTGVNNTMSNQVWSHSWPCLQQEAGPETSQGPFPTWINLWSNEIYAHPLCIKCCFLTYSQNFLQKLVSTAAVFWVCYQSMSSDSAWPVNSLIRSYFQC